MELVEVQTAIDTHIWSVILKVELCNLYFALLHMHTMNLSVWLVIIWKYIQEVVIQW